MAGAGAGSGDEERHRGEGDIEEGGPSVEGGIREADRLREQEDPVTEPFRSKYKARELLQKLLLRGRAQEDEQVGAQEDTAGPGNRPATPTPPICANIRGPATLRAVWV